MREQIKPGDVYPFELDAGVAGIAADLRFRVEDDDDVVVIAEVDPDPAIVEFTPKFYRRKQAVPTTKGYFTAIWRRVSSGLEATEQFEVTATGLAAADPDLETQVRAKIGDPNGELLDGDELAVHLVAWPDNADLAAANAAEAIAAKYARDYSFQTAEGQRFSRSERVEHYMTLSRDLRSRGGALIWPTPAPAE